MTKELCGKRKVITEEGRRLNFSYYKLHTRMGYGICVKGQRAACTVIMGNVVEGQEVDRLMRCLMKGRVSPVSLRDVVKDWMRAEAGGH